ncbi:MAG: chitobiase/beta-hexosaminidase C-terminal domain-containing protein [Treponema sp.]|nr:chitobiase/beta-hexosaminidase C-terminal domain-containing protein [Treponema sp.]
MKKIKTVALLASAALAFGGIFASCSGDTEEKIVEKEVEKEVKVDKTYAAAVTFTVADDTAGTGKTVTLATATAGAVIHYTTTGAVPTSGSATYSEAIPVTEDTVIKALAVKEGIENSPISVASISIKNNEVTVYKDSENAVGSEITIDGTKYYVISNQLSSTKNASRAAVETESAESEDVTGLVDTGDEETDMAIEKFASNVYVRKFLAEVGITKYIQVWNPAQKEKDSNATSAN